MICRPDSTDCQHGNGLLALHYMKRHHQACSTSPATDITIDTYSPDSPKSSTAVNAKKMTNALPEQSSIISDVREHNDRW
eukprot:scaffold375536_cov23-Prasinocladus_malaysianus.AAC.1